MVNYAKSFKMFWYDTLEKTYLIHCAQILVLDKDEEANVGACSSWDSGVRDQDKVVDVMLI